MYTMLTSYFLRWTVGPYGPQVDQDGIYCQPWTLTVDTVSQFCHFMNLDLNLCTRYLLAQVSYFIFNYLDRYF